MSARALWRVLGVAAVVAAYVALRMYRLPYVDPLPWSGPYVDEANQVIYGLHLVEGLTPAMLGWPATVYTLILAALNGIHLMVKLVLGDLGPVHDRPGAVLAATEYFVAFYRDPTGWFIVGRLVSLMFGVGALLCAVAIAKAYVGPTAALAAAAVYLVLPLDRFFSQVAVTETASAFFAVAAMAAVLRIRRGAGIGAPIMLGLLLGLALGTKYTTIVLLPPAVLAVVLMSRDWPSWRAVIRRPLALMTLSLVLATIAGNPFLLAQPVTVLREIIHPVDVGRDFSAASLLLTGRDTVHAFGVPAVALALVGLAMCLARRRWDLVLAIGAPPTLLFFLAYSHALKYPRYLIVMTPFLAILSGICIQATVDTFRKMHTLGESRGTARIRTGVTYAVALAALVFSGVYYSTTRASFEDSVHRGLESWIEAHVPEHSLIIFWNAPVRVQQDLRSLERIAARIDSRDRAIAAKWATIFPEAAVPRVTAFSDTFTIDEQLLRRSLLFRAEVARRDGDRGYDVDVARHRTVSYGLPGDSVRSLLTSADPAYLVFREWDAEVARVAYGLLECYRGESFVVRASVRCPS